MGARPLYITGLSHNPVQPSKTGDQAQIEVFVEIRSIDQVKTKR